MLSSRNRNYWKEDLVENPERLGVFDCAGNKVGSIRALVGLPDRMNFGNKGSIVVSINGRPVDNPLLRRVGEREDINVGPSRKGENNNPSSRFHFS